MIRVASVVHCFSASCCRFASRLASFGSTPLTTSPAAMVAALRAAFSLILGPRAEGLALGAPHPRLGEQVDPGPAAGRAHAHGETGQLVVVEIMLRLARRQRCVADHRVGERQLVCRLRS